MLPAYANPSEPTPTGNSVPSISLHTNHHMNSKYYGHSDKNTTWLIVLVMPKQLANHQVSPFALNTYRSMRLKPSF